MKLTTQTASTWVRRLASAPAHELEEARLELNAWARDDGQPEDVRFASRRTASIIQALLSRRG